MTARDPSLGLIGLLFIAGPAVIWWGAWRLIDEVVVVDDQIRWEGLHRRGTAALAELEAIRPAGFIGGSTLTFVIDGRRRFELLPARGVGAFLDAVRRARPGVAIALPASMRVLGRFSYGRFVDDGPN